MKIALLHDWLVAQRGGENVLLELCRMFPEAPVYTLVHRKGAVHPEIEARDIRTSFIQSLPGSSSGSFRRYLPLFPAAVERWDLRDYDLLISTSHCVVHGVRTHQGQIHLSYVHSPMRYLYDQLPHYLPAGMQFLEPLARSVTTPLRRWNARAARRPTRLVANSSFVAERIKRVWARDAGVVHPPVDVECFAPHHGTREGLLIVSALVPYKRNDVAVRLCTAEHLPLTVIGDGPERERLRSMAGPSVRFIGPQPKDELRDAYQRAEALLFCGEEDFGIVPLEAMACGCPVVALGRGGALESVVGEGTEATGVFIPEPSPLELHRGIRRLRQWRAQGRFDADTLHRRAQIFSPANFRKGIAAELGELKQC